MSRRLLLATLVTLALLVAACGRSDEPSAGVDDPAPAPQTDGDAGTDAAGGTRPALPPIRDIRPDVVQPRPRGFDSALYDETDESLHVLFTSGREPCAALADVEVVEDAEHVTVTLHEGHGAGSDVDCPDDAQPAAARVELTTPLADRELVDGTTGEPVPVDRIRAGDAPAA